MTKEFEKCLLLTLSNDVEHFLKSWQDEIFYNENILQRELFSYLLKSNHYDGLDFEYALPNPNNNDDLIFIDIVVNRCGYYCLMELKLKTYRKRDEYNLQINCFGQTVKLSKRGNGAEKDNRISFWNDVSRIETLTRKYERVVGGIAVFVTNDHLYWKNGFVNKLSEDSHGVSHCIIWNDVDEINKKLHIERDDNRFRFVIIPILKDWKDCQWGKRYKERKSQLKHNQYNDNKHKP